MARLPSAKRSPRIVNGIIYWYQGDTFSLTVRIDLKDQDGEPITIDDQTDDVDIVFRNCREETVKTFSFGAAAQTTITDNTITMAFDSTVTALFTRGKYRYDVYYNGEYRTTLADENVVVVE
ncbi:MAG: hypothetical protein IKZ82_06160 [Clostridia bacterium]|nr:hypothetical protein [Clostridia bacterium]